MILNIRDSHLKTKKYDAVFNDEGKIKVIPFGARGMSDYTEHGDKARRERYLKRHSKNEDWDNMMTAGALSRWILWGDSTNINKNIANFKKKFKIEK